MFKGFSGSYQELKFLLEAYNIKLSENLACKTQILNLLNYTDDTHIDIDKRGIIFANISIKLADSVNGIKLNCIRSVTKAIKDYLLFCGEQLFKIKSNELRLISEYENIEKTASMVSGPTIKVKDNRVIDFVPAKRLSDEDMLNIEFDSVLTLSYWVFKGYPALLTHKLLSYVLNHLCSYLDSKSVDYDIAAFYTNNGKSRIIDIDRLESYEIVQKLKEKLTKGENPLIFANWCPNLDRWKDGNKDNENKDRWSLQDIYIKIKKHFSDKRVCAICGEKFKPAYNNPNQYVCSDCVKFKHQKKNALKRYLAKHNNTTRQQMVKYMKEQEKKYLKRFKDKNMKKVKYWDKLIDRLLEEIRLEKARKID